MSPEPTRDRPSAADGERLFQSIVERAPAILWTTDLDLRFTSGRGGGLVELGLASDQLVGVALRDYLGSDDPENPALAAHAAALAGESRRYELAWAGQIYQCVVEPRRAPDGAVLGVVGLALDVTEARRSSLVERSLFRISEEAARSRDLQAFCAALHAIVGDLMYAGNFYLALVDDVQGTISFPYFVDELDVAPPPRPLARGLTEYVLRTGQPLHAPPDVEAELVARGEVEPIGAPAVDWLGAPLVHDGKTYGAVAVQSYREGIHFRDDDRDVLHFVARQIAAALAARAGVEERERTLELLRATLEATADGILVVDERGAVVVANQRFATMWRLPPELVATGDDQRLLAFVVDQLVDPDTFLATIRELYRDPDATVLDALRFRDGRVFERQSRATSIGGSTLRVWSFRDVSEREHAAAALAASEEELRQAQKMEALGRMAGGIAHDFNNLLTVIAGYADLLASHTPADSPRRNEIEAIRKAGRRAAELTSQLLAVGRRQPVVRRVVDLNSELRGLQSWLRRLIGEDVDLQLDLDPRLFKVHADPGQIEQIVLNLVVNARDAMPAGGQLTLSTSNRDLDDTLSRPHVGVSSGDYATIEVRDTGTGMDRATAERIFEPFFTTKEVGKGTGLGLSTVYGIVRQNGGFVEVDSALGVGTSFRIHLPRVEGEEVHETGERQATAHGRGEVVLLAEDDPAVRAFLVRFLREEGYRPLEAGDGRQALAIAAAAAGPIHALVTDVVMPNLGGIELAGQLRADRPALPVLLLTGYATDLPNGASDRRMRLLSKPVVAAELARALRELLDDESTAP